MEFRISRETPIRWPDKCVWCTDSPIMRYPAVGKGFLGIKWKFEVFGRGSGYRFEYARVDFEYPVCRKHFFWSMGGQIVLLVFWGGMVLGLILSIYLALYFAELFIYHIGVLLCLVFAAMFILTILLQPVRANRVRTHSYTMVIRNEMYAREFAMINSLNPI
jgi:hypothetical protein